MANKVYHIVKSEDGGWNVKKSGSSRSSLHTETKAEAVEAATKMLKNGGGGEFVVQDIDGKVKERRHYVLTASGGQFKLTFGNVGFVFRDSDGRITNQDEPLPPATSRPTGVAKSAAKSTMAKSAANSSISKSAAKSSNAKKAQGLSMSKAVSKSASKSAAKSSTSSKTQRQTTSKAKSTTTKNRGR